MSRRGLWSAIVLFHLLVQLGQSINVISNFVLPLDIRDPRDPTKVVRVQQQTATFACTETDADSSHTFEVITPQAGYTKDKDGKQIPKPPIVSRFQVQCVPPTYIFIRRELGKSPLYVVPSRYQVTMTPYNQNSTLPESVDYDFRAAMDIGQQAGYGRRLLALPGAPGRIKSSLILGGGGVGIGVDLGCLIDWAPFGGCGAGDLDDVMGALREQLDAITQFTKESKAWMEGAETRFGNLEGVVELLAQNDALNRDSISRLNREIPLLWQFEKELAYQVTEGFTTLKGYLMQEQAASDETKKMILALFNSTDQQFLETNRALQGQSRLVQNLITTVWSLYRDSGMRRAVTQLYWDMSDSPFVVPQSLEQYQPLCQHVSKRYCDKNIGKTRRFVGSGLRAGNPPMEPHEREVRNEAVSLTMADTVIQWTEWLGAGSQAQRYAFSVTLELKCDRMFMLNNNVPGMSLKVLFARLGPTDCSSQNPNNPWTCACIAKWTQYSCKMKDQRERTVTTQPYPADYTFYPYIINGQTVKMRRTLQENQNLVCADPIPNPTVLYLDSRPKLEAQFIRTFCTQETALREYDSLRGWTFSVASTDVGTTRNVSTTVKRKSGTGYETASCTSSFYGNGGGSSNSVSSNLYYFWIETYKVLSKSLLIQQEDKVFGALPYGIEISNIPFDRLNNTVGGNVRTTEVKFTSIAENPVKLEYLSLESTFAGISGKMVNKQGQLLGANDEEHVQIELQPGVQEFEWPNIGAPDPETQRLQNALGDLPWLFVPNRTLTTNVVMTVKGVEAILPYLFRYGDDMTDFVYDVPQDLVGTANSPGALCNKLNYLLKGANWTGDFPAFTRDSWDQHNPGTTYKSDCATESVLFFRRYLTPRTGENKRSCEYNFWSGGGPGSFPEYTMCSLLRNFQCEDTVLPNGAKAMVCKPNQYTVQATLAIPAGTLQSTVTTDCPDVKVSANGGKTLVTLTSAAAFPNMVRVVTQQKPGKPPCPGNVYPSRDVTLYPRQPTDILFNECPAGSMLMNVFTILNPGTPCFRQWIDVSETKDYVSPFIDTKPIAEDVRREVSDPLADILAKQLVAQVDFQNELDRIQQKYWNDRQGQYQAIRDLVKNRTIDINRDLNVNITDKIKPIDKIIDEQSKIIDENVQKAKNNTIELQKLIGELKELNKQGRIQIDNLNKTVQRIIDANKETQKAIDEWRKWKNNQDKCSLGGIPILGSLVCWVTDLFSGGGSWITKIIGVIFWILILACCCYILVMCLMQCAKCGGSAEWRQQASYELAHPGQPRLPTETEMQYIQAWLAQHQGSSVPPLAESVRVQMEAMKQAAAKAAPTITAETKPLLTSVTGTASRSRFASVARIQ